MCNVGNQHAVSVMQAEYEVRYIKVTSKFPGICNSYITGTSALPDIYAQAQGPQARVRIYRQSTSARGITNMFYFSM